MKPTELSDPQIAELLARRRIVRIALVSEEETYLVPLGYVWHRDALYCITGDGKKIAMARCNPRVAFQVDDSADTGLLGWTSVTGEGVVEILPDDVAMARVRQRLRHRFADVPGADALWSAPGLLWLRITPLRVSGRRSVLDSG